MSKLVLLDIDSVLLDWLDGFDNWMIETGIASTFGYVDPTPPRSPYDLSAKYGLPDSQILSLIVAFSKSYGFGKLQPMEGAEDGVKTLRKLGCSLHLISSFTDDPIVMQNRIENLWHVFGYNSFTGFTFLPLHASKKESLRSLVQKKPIVWVDDVLPHVLSGIELGIRSVYFDPYLENLHLFEEQSIPQATSWKELTPIVEDYINEAS